MPAPQLVAELADPTMRRLLAEPLKLAKVHLVQRPTKAMLELQVGATNCLSPAGPAWLLLRPGPRL